MDYASPLAWRTSTRAANKMPVSYNKYKGRATNSSVKGSLVGVMIADINNITTIECLLNDFSILALIIENFANT
jgi:hypothetical protein